MAPTSSMKTIAATAILILADFLVPCEAHGSGSSNDSSSTSTATNTDSLHSKSLIDVKISCLVIMLASTFLAGVSPYFFRWNESFLLLGTQFAGGVFLGTAMMHFLGDSTSTFTSLTTKAYPFSFMLACAGYLLTMLSDCVIQWIVSKSKGQSIVEGEGKELEDGKGGHSMDVPPGLTKTTHVGDTILLILALCFHSIFEGIAVGISDTKADAWRNLWTISMHKIFAAISMGIALLRMLPNKPLFMTVSYALMFAISSPIGIAIGIAIDATAQGAVADWIFSISMALAAGVFVYVAINHLISKGFKPLHPSYFDTPFYKFIAVLLGVAIIAVVLIWD